MNKTASFYVIFTVLIIGIEEKCVILPSHSAMSAKDILLNTLSITTRETTSKLPLLGLQPIRAQLSHIWKWLVVSRERYGEGLRHFCVDRRGVDVARTEDTN